MLGIVHGPGRISVLKGVLRGASVTACFNTAAPPHARRPAYSGRRGCSASRLLFIALFLLGLLCLVLRLAIEIKDFLRPARTGRQQGKQKRETQKILLHGTTVSKSCRKTRDNQISRRYQGFSESGVPLQVAAALFSC